YRCRVAVTDAEGTVGNVDHLDAEDARLERGGCQHVGRPGRRVELEDDVARQIAAMGRRCCATERANVVARWRAREWTTLARGRQSHMPPWRVRRRPHLHEQPDGVVVARVAPGVLPCDLRGYAQPSAAGGALD